MENILSNFEFMSNLPENLVVLPDFLRGEWGEYVHREVVNKYGAAEHFVTKSVSFDSVVKGSKPGYVVAVNEILRKNKLRTATQIDLEKILKMDKLKLKGFYEDSALILRSRDEPNSYLANSLANQIEEEFPVMIPLTELNLIEDEDSLYEFSFNLRENAKVISSSALNKRGNFKEVDEKGIPRIGERGRTFYARNSGLSRLILDVEFDLISDYVFGLSFSNNIGRVIVCGE